MGIEQMKLNKKNSLQTAYEKIPALESQITRYDSMIRLSRGFFGTGKDTL